MPMPRLREKKVCPSAFMNTDGVIFEKSGDRKYSSPSAAPGSVNATTQRASRMTNSSGISTFDSFSMPFCTPRNRIMILRPITMAVAKSGCHVP